MHMKSNPESSRTSVSHSFPHWVLLALVVGFGTACVSEDELFVESQQRLAEGVGEMCAPSVAAGAGEVVVEEGAPECEGTTVCLSMGENQEGLPAGNLCSCRCEGEPGTGPLCACPSEFLCVPAVENVGWGSEHVAGSYCWPSP